MTSPPAVDHNASKVAPSCGMAAVPDVGADYWGFLFPSACMSSIDLASTNKIPVTYVDYLAPTANMTASTMPLTSRTFTNEETDELFTPDILRNHKQAKTNFQADWGANIIIVNDKTLFTDFISCEASLNPVDSIPIQKIKGYGTVIFSVGNRFVPVREIAYMPGNLQCTFTTSHLQRMNGFLPGIHAMYSSVKIVSPDRISTKFVPVKKNG